jgi:Tfp pilus assembly protein PilW
MTLLEIMVVLGVLSLAMIGIFQVVIAGTQTYELSSIEADLDMRGHNALQTMVDDLENAGVGTIDLTPSAQGYTKIVFQTNQGFDEGTGDIIWNTPVRSISYEWKPAAGKEGLANDGDLVRTIVKSTGASTQDIIVRQVAPIGFSVTQNGNLLTLSLTLQRESATMVTDLNAKVKQPKVWSSTASTAVKLMN